MNNEFSIITVCYNCKNTIEKTLLSVIHQTYNNFQYIIIDGGSTDGTLDIIYQYKDKINVILTEPDKGVYDAMNKGIKLANGKWINFMNSGDTFYNLNVLSDVSKSINSETDIIYGNTCIELTPSIRYCLLPDKLTSIEDKLPFCHQSCFIKTSIAQENLFDLSFKYVADYALFYYLYNKKAKFQYINAIISNYQIGSGLTASNAYLCYLEKYRVNGKKISFKKKIKMKLTSNIQKMLPKSIIKITREKIYKKNKRFILITCDGN